MTEAAIPPLAAPPAKPELALLARITPMPDAAAKAAFLAALTAPPKPTVVSFLNAHAFNLAERDAEFRANLMAADALFRDGVGVSAMLRLLGADAGLNMNGTDLIPEILRACRGRRVALAGTAEPWLSRAATELREQGQVIVQAIDGFQGLAATVNHLCACDADLFVLAMGMPRQEEVAAELAARLDRPAVILNGGAILDFIAGRFPRAPEIWRRLRLEWLYRLIHEPRRLWRRYILGGVVFAFHGARLRLLHGRLKPHAR